MCTSRQLHLYGPPRLPAVGSHLHLAERVSRGATTITADGDIDWRVGESVLIGSTEFDWSQAETRTISAVAGRVLSLDKPLDWAHHGAPNVSP